MKRTTKRDWFSIKMQDNDTSATILIYDEIGMWGVAAIDFIKRLDELVDMGVKVVHVRLNTPGGDFFDGVAIYNALRRMSAAGVRIETWVDSLAASAGSLIAMAGDVKHIAENAFLMVHEPWSMMAGNAVEYRQEADRLDQLTAAALKSYVGGTGMKEADMLALLKAETWVGSDAALELGFADEIVTEADADKLLHQQHDLSKFKHVPKPLLIDSENDIMSNKKALEAALREAGVSKREAREIVSVGLRALREADVIDDDNIEVTAEMQNSVDSILATLTT